MITKEQISSKPAETEVAPGISAAQKVAYGLMLAGTVALTVTGIGTFVLGHPPMTHWMLMAHVSAAPLFAIGLALVSLTWADRCRFGCADSRHSGATKTLLWLILASGLIVILSGVVPMLPVYGTIGLHTLYLIHRYSAIVLAASIVLHLLNVLRGR